MKRILVVDNDLLMLAFMKDVLSKEGHKVATAEDGLSALDLVKKQRFHVVFIDLIMPRIDGKRLCNILRKMESLEQTYLVILSAVAAEEGVTLTEMGADICIAKGPLDVMGQNVLAAVERPEALAAWCAAGRVLGLEEINPRAITGELLTVKRHFEVILEAMSEGILEVTGEGRIIYVNPAALTMLQVSEERLLGTPFADYVAVKDRRLFQKLLEGAVSTGKRAGRNLPVQVNDRQALLSILPVENDRGLTAMIILNDVSEQKRMEAQLIQANKMEALGTLAGGIAHNFNNLLMGIQGNVALMLLEMDENHLYRKKLKAIEDYARSGEGLTKRLLGLTRGGGKEARPIDINAIVKRTSEMFVQMKKEINVHTTCKEGLWTVEADPGQMEQVLLNLLVNAWQAMPGGGNIHVETQNVVLDEAETDTALSGRQVKLSVGDTGTGMDRRTQDRAFDPFFTTKPRSQGTGLGLFSVHGIVKAHGGMIKLRSDIGQGTTFDIFLPAVKGTPRDEQRPGEKIVGGHETVLLVDDEEWILDVGRQMIEKLGYRSLVAKGGKAALRVYEANKAEIDMVILDVIMPGMGGQETFEALKRINPHIRVLLSSGYDLDGQAADMVQRGKAGFIQKPFDMNTLSRKTREILNTNREAVPSQL